MSLPASAQMTAGGKNKLSFNIYGDYQSEDFQWSIAGNSNGQNPNVLSEVIWKNIQSKGAGAAIQWNICSGILFKGDYHRSFIYSGTATDTDYAQDNRSNPTYQANLNSNDGNSFAYSAALGYEIAVGKRISLAPYAGYTKSRQFLYLKNFKEEGGDEIKKLNSTYQANWSGAVIGMDAKFELNSFLSAKAVVNYKQLSYQGYADWNLIDAFAHPVSFKHTANGFETAAAIQFDFRITSAFSALIRGNYGHAETGTGKDQLYLIDGGQRESQFNGSKRTFKGVGIGFSLNL